jgi:SAM-dependent methyltransferase
VLLVDDDPDPTMWVAKASLTAARDAANRPPDDLFLDTLGVTEAERETMRRLPRDGAVDPVVSVIIPATSGHLYVARQGRFTTYPIPTLRLPPGGGARLLDVGCNWGRWCVAAARGGYRPVGIDPSLGAVLAAQRVASSLGITADFVVADARRLPFAPASFDVVFSYSVLQHFSRENVAAALREVGRVLASGGKSFVQMPNRIGVRTLYNQARRRFREAEGFDVRFWGLSELEDVFGQLVGPSTITVDGFFGLGIQPTDVAHMKPAHQLVCYASELLRHASARVPALTRVADSVYVTSIAR